MKKLNANQPKRPAKDDPVALKKYLAARKSYTAQRQRLVQQEKSLRRRSEEHTSELQSQAYLVCRLLLEKKKQTKASTERRT